MADLGGIIASAVLKVVMQQLSSAISRPITSQILLQLNFSADLMKMRMALQSVEAVLQDAERRSVKDAAVRLWLKRLKDAMFDISDMLYEFETYARPPGRKSFVKKYVTIVSKIKMANNMKMVKEKLKEITDQNRNFSLMVGPTSMELKGVDVRETSSDVGEAVIIGRTKDKQKIKDYLSERMAQKIIILPIYGIGGIGKTTLAKLIFNDAHFKDYSQVWVYVSQTFDLNKIGNSIISQLSGKESQLTERQMICSFLGKLLAHKKIMIVLDDLWENDAYQLESMKDMLTLGDQSNVIVIVTTRNEAIAEKISTIEPYKIELLTDDMCWEIIKQKSRFETRDDKEQLEDVGRQIAIKCGGVALAAQSLAYMLQNMRSDEWESVKDSDIWNESTSEDASSPHHVLASLKLSYSSMPSYLKLCFSYCAIFPKGHMIIKDDLIHQWVSLGFIEESSIHSTKQLGERYIRQLLGLSFLQCSRSQLTAVAYHEDITLFTMHDLVHDLARSVMVDEILYTSKVVNIVDTIYRYALLTDGSKPLELFTYYPAKIRAIFFLSYDEFVCGTAFSSAKSLRVLDLSHCYIQKLPDHIGQLKQLRYLNAPWIEAPVVPNCITKLSNLIYLNLHGSSEIIALPELIGEMKGLMHLDLSDCSGIKKLPESFGNLKRLVYLDLSNCYYVIGVTEILGSLTELQHLNLSYCQTIGELPQALSYLVELQYLNLSGSSYLYGRPYGEYFGTLTKLEYLELSSSSSDLKSIPEALGSFIKLKYLNLSGCTQIEELPRSFGKLKNLVHLNLSYCRRARGIPEFLSFFTKLTFLNLRHCCFIDGAQLQLKGIIRAMQNLTELRYLNLSNCLQDLDEYQVCDFIECISTLSNLEHLDLSENISLRSIPESFGSLIKLHTLDLTRCALLDRLPESILKIDSLKILIVKDCSLPHSLLHRFNNNAALLPHFMVLAGDGESSSSLLLLQEANPPELAISRLENVKSAKEAKAIRLRTKFWIQKLTFEWTSGANRFVEDMEVLEELVPPGRLQKLDIKGYGSVTFPGWLMGITHLSIATYLACLVTVTFRDMPKCNGLPPLGQLPRLQKLVIEGMDSIRKIDEDFYGGAGAFPQLKVFELNCMKSLEEWITIYSSGEDGANELIFPTLEKLTIRDCPKLRLKPQPPKADNWTIWNSDNVISLWEENAKSTDVSSSCLVTNLVVRSCMVPFHQWRLLHHLPALTSLSIEYCDDLTGSPGIIQDLSSLQSLSLEDNDQLKFPTWLGDITSLQVLQIFGYQELEAPQETMKQLTSLKSLMLCHCKSMTTLPQWLGELTTLQELQITKWPQLNCWLESMRHLTSLQKLEMDYCGSIKALPEWLGDLASLKKLHISDCEGIESLPESISGLTELEVLRISHCPKLMQWYVLDENKMKLAHVKEKGFY